MTDLIYLAVTVAFFGAMLGYVRACAHLGERAAGEAPPQ